MSSSIMIAAEMRGPMTGAPMLDALLMSVVASRMGLVAGFGDMQDVDNPIDREPGGRFFMCSSPVVSWDAHESRYVHRRFPVAEAQMHGESKLRRVNIAVGSCRSYRLPHEVRWASGDRVVWYVTGDEDPIRELLTCVTHIGRRRAVGRGPVRSWIVEPCEPWGPDYPIARDGAPMRPLPADWAGLVDPSTGYHTLAPPYWGHEREELCAVPS